MAEDPRSDVPSRPRGATVADTRGHRLPASGAVLGGRKSTRPTASRDDDPTVELGPGMRMLGPYLLVEQVGQGGMGVVHKAVDRDGNEVAIKVLRPHIAHDESARDRLRREVSTLARVRHERVAPVLDADVDGESPYLVTQYVPGPPLDDVVEERGALSPAQLATLGRELAEALGAIHAAGVVHRDVKPGNVLMVGDDPVLIDFGIAHVADDVRLTMTGMVMGTPGYLSPEVVEGAPVTEATDWWGWAATLAFAASGKAPFGRGPMPLVLDRVTRGQADLSDVDERLRPLLASALSPVPGERPSADRVLAELQEYAAGRHTTGIPVSEPAPVRQPPPDAARPRTQQTPVTPPTQAQPVTQPDPTSVLPVAAPTADPYRTPDPRPATGPQHAPAAPPQQTGPVPAVTDPYERPAPPSGDLRRWSPETTGAAPDAYGRSTDPRIGRPARTGSLIALFAALLGITALWPVVGLTLLALWSVAARWVDRSMTAMVLRRFQQGVRKSDGVMAVVASPWHGVRAVLATCFALLLPAFVAALAGITTALGMSIATGDDPDLSSSPPWVVGALVATWMLWWGPGGTSIRRGSRSMVRGALRTQPVTAVVVVACGALATVCLLLSLQNGLSVDWWPWSGEASWFRGDWLPRLTG